MKPLASGDNSSFIKQENSKELAASSLLVSMHAVNIKRRVS
jgi:hypothetical protein